MDIVSFAEIGGVMDNGLRVVNRVVKGLIRAGSGVDATDSLDEVDGDIVR
jgi:hypothetical protein